MTDQPKTLEIDFRECPNCGGYGVRDDGKNCTTCGGVGGGGLRGGLWSRPGDMIGSGEIMVERGTGRIVSLEEFNRHHGIGRDG